MFTAVASINSPVDSRTSAFARICGIRDLDALITDAGETVLKPGMCAGFKAGRRDAHHLVNRTEQEVVYLEVGDRAERDMVHYPDDDIVAAISADGRWRFVHKDGRPYLL